MKIVIITDQHSGIGGDSDEMYDYQMKFYNETFFPYLEEHNIKTLIQCGDFMDRRKYVNYKTLNRWRTNYIYRLRDMGVTQHNIIGNHDCHHKNTNSVNSMTELFSNVDNFHIYPEAVDVNIHGVDLLFMPWICEENREHAMNMIKTSQSKIMFGHLELRDFEMYRGAPMHEGLDYALFQRFDAVYSGHYHHKSSRGNIHYLGAPCEYTWSDYADERGFHVFDTDTKQMEYIRNPHRMFHKINYDDSSLTNAKQKANLVSKFADACEKYKGCRVKVIVGKKTDGVLFEEFVDKLYKANPADVSIMDTLQDYVFEEDVDTDILAQDTTSILTSAVNGITLLEDGEKRELHSLLSSLYSDALAMGADHA